MGDSSRDRESLPLLGESYEDDDVQGRADVSFDDQPIQERWDEEHEREKAAFEGDVESQDPPRSAPGVVRVRTAHSHHAPAVRARRTAWICLDTLGHASYLHADKRAVMQMLDLHVPVRDMRLLDFNLISSGKILVRDNALIFSIEHVRFVVSADTVLIPRDGLEQNPLARRCVARLQRAIAQWHAAKVRQEEAERLRDENGDFASDSRDASSAPPQAAASEPPAGSDGASGKSSRPPSVVKSTQLAHGVGEPAIVEAGSDLEDESAGLVQLDYELLPFELVVLEVALKEVLAATTTLVRELECVAMPALDALTRSITSASLERIRKVKTRHQRLLIRCETLRDEMERFLADDEDMMKMCLTRRRELEEAREDLGGGGRAVSTPMNVGSLRRSPFTQLRESGSGNLDLRGRSGALPAAPLSDHEDLVDDVEAVENLLESYYVQIDSLYDKVVSLDEYIKDTEEYINIELDASRNRLIRLEILLTAAAFSMAPFNLIAGILGENLVLPKDITTKTATFWQINLGMFLFCASAFLAVLVYMRRAKLV